MSLAMNILTGINSKRFRSSLAGVSISFASAIAFFCCCESWSQVAPLAAKSVDISKTDLPDGEAMKVVEEVKGKLIKLRPSVEFPTSSERKSEDEDMKGIQIKGFALKVAYVSKSLNLEEDSHYARKWFVELSKTLDLLSQVKLEAELAVENKDKDRYALCMDRFIKGIKYYKDLAGKPVKLTDADLKRIREENELVRKQARNERLSDSLKKK